ncbi:MAG: M23 family metallopeptidase [Ignavibacteria bacterium]|nr:M23 family metallopeptidase [Ignavibacteria bacterium]
MDLKKLTIQLIGKEDEPIKTLTINKTFIINHKKYLIAAGSALTAILVLFFVIFAYSVKVSVDKYSLNSQLFEVNTKLQKYDSLELSQKLNRIDNNLSMINIYLLDRGIINPENSGGKPSNSKQETIVSKINEVEERSILFSGMMRDIPMGYPYNGILSSNYGYRKNPFGGYSGEFHPGIDIKGPMGDQIFATADGIVNRCDNYNGYGNAVVLDHKCGLQTLYGHLTKVNVVQGQFVKAGDVIGFLGSTGRSTGPHIHYEIRRNNDDINPEPYVKVY